MNRVFGKKQTNKYGAKKFEVDGIKFDSKKEGNRYLQLKILQKAGEVSYFLRQVPFHLPGNVTYRVDFAIFWQDGAVTYEDVKGFMTPMSKLKIKQTEDLYPVKIEVI